jgi:hypothetical protein
VRQLHVLGVSDDGAALLLATADGAKPTHRLALDDRLRAAVRGQLAASGADRVESALSPKEIQARMRAGATPEEVAKAAGVPVARVVPYAAPVEAERQRMVDEARAAVMHRNRGPEGSKPLGELVDARLRDVPGLKSESVEWTARRRPDGAWVVLLSYAARGGRRSATWLWRPAERDLTSLDVAASRLAADGGSAAKGKVRRRPAGDRPKPAAKRSAKPTAKKASTPKPAARKASSAATRGKPAATKRASAPKPSTAKRKPTVQAPAANRNAAPKAPARKRATHPPLRVVEPIREPQVAQAQDEAAASTRRTGARVPIPSWSDVLLGVQSPPRDNTARQPQSSPRRRRKS